MKRILTYLYSGLSLFVGIWGIVSGLVSLNGATNRKQLLCIHFSRCFNDFRTCSSVRNFQKKQERYAYVY